MDGASTIGNIAAAMKVAVEQPAADEAEANFSDAVARSDRAILSKRAPPSAEGGGGGDRVGDENENENAHLLDLRLLHMSCDADPASGTRAPDVRLILRLANDIQRSIAEGKFELKVKKNGAARGRPKRSERR